MSKVRPVRVFAASLLVLAALPAAAPAQQPVEGPKLTSKVAEIQIGGRVHTHFSTTSVDGFGSALFLRRVRLEANVKVNDVVSGKIQPDFAGNRVSLKDAYLKLSFSPGLEVLAGNAHRPFSLVEQTSSNRMLPIERGLAIVGVSGVDEYRLVSSLGYSDRDIGVQVMGAPERAPLGFTYAVGVLRGPLHGAPQRVDTLVKPNDSYQVAARATVELAPALVLGAGWSNRAFGAVEGGLILDTERGDAFEVDLEYGTFARGLHLLGEVAIGDADPLAGTDFLGAQGWLSYRTAPISRVLQGVEPGVRVSYGSLDRSGEAIPRLGGILVTPAISLWVGGLNRLSLNYDVWLPAADELDTAHSFKAMFQLAF